MNIRSLNERVAKGTSSSVLENRVFYTMLPENIQALSEADIEKAAGKMAAKAGKKPGSKEYEELKAKFLKGMKGVQDKMAKKKEAAGESCDTPGMKKRSKGKGRGLARGDGKGPRGIPAGEANDDDDDEGKKNGKKGKVPPQFKKGDDDNGKKNGDDKKSKKNGKNGNGDDDDDECTNGKKKGKKRVVSAKEMVERVLNGDDPTIVANEYYDGDMSSYEEPVAAPMAGDDPDLDDYDDEEDDELDVELDLEPELEPEPYDMTGMDDLEPDMLDVNVDYVPYESAKAGQAPKAGNKPDGKKDVKSVSGQPKKGEPPTSKKA